MSRLMIICGLTAAGAFGWWAWAPGALTVPSVPELNAPAKRAAKADPLALTAARWRAPGRPGLFEPPSDAAAPPAADPNALRLVGASTMPGRRAALVSVNGAAPIWLELGQPQGGVELIELGSGRARLRTASGEVSLFVFPDPDKPKEDHAS